MYPFRGRKPNQLKGHKLGDRAFCADHAKVRHRSELITERPCPGKGYVTDVEPKTSPSVESEASI